MHEIEEWCRFIKINVFHSILPHGSHVLLLSWHLNVIHVCNLVFFEQIWHDMTHSDGVSTDCQPCPYGLEWRGRESWEKGSGGTVKAIQNCRFCAVRPVRRQDRSPHCGSMESNRLVLFWTGLCCSEFMKSKSFWNPQILAHLRFVSFVFHFSTASPSKNLRTGFFSFSFISLMSLSSAHSKKSSRSSLCIIQKTMKSPAMSSFLSSAVTLAVTTWALGIVVLFFLESGGSSRHDVCWCSLNPPSSALQCVRAGEETPDPTHIVGLPRIFKRRPLALSLGPVRRLWSCSWWCPSAFVHRHPLLLILVVEERHDLTWKGLILNLLLVWLESVRAEDLHTSGLAQHSTYFLLSLFASFSSFAFHLLFSFLHVSSKSCCFSSRFLLLLPFLLASIVRWFRLPIFFLVFQLICLFLSFCPDQGSTR